MTETKSREEKRGACATCGLTLFIITAILGALAIIGSLSDKGSDQQQTTDIAERKQRLGLDYEIGLDRTPTMSRPGVHFSALLVPAEPRPSVEQLKALGEIVRDEYQDQPFVWVWFWNDPEAASTDWLKYDVENDREWAALQKQQEHLLMQYNKNNVSGNDELEIYPQGFTDTESADVVRIDY